MELEWSILAMAVAELLALKEQLAKKPSKSGDQDPPPDPIKRSLAETMRALRQCLRHLDDVPEPGRDLASLLRDAVTDHDVRKASKQPRHRPPNPDKKPLGDPKLRPMTAQEKQRLEQIDAKMAA